MMSCVNRVFMMITLLFLVIIIINVFVASTAEAFNCTSVPTCQALIDYVSPNTTELSTIQTLFGLDNYQSLLGANNFPFPLSSSNHTVFANDTIRVPFQCRCTNGTGISDRRPVYTVLPDDGLDHIARDVFSGLVTYQQIQAVNNISDPDEIGVGQELWIPLPCGCDEVKGERVVHYGHVVKRGSTVAGIAQQYGSSENTLLKLNGLATPNDLMAGAVLDVPLKACTSKVASNSLDYPLLVANDTYVFTATDCVLCKCNAANNWTLKCEPSNVNSSYWPSCPTMQCQGAERLYLGNTTSNGGCDRTCDYAGYTNQTILTTLPSESTCSVPANSAPKFSLRGWSWDIILIAVQLIMVSLHLHQ